jgi:hypothetical protein
MISVERFARASCAAATEHRLIRARSRLRKPYARILLKKRLTSGTIEEGAERRHLLAVRHGLDISPGTTFIVALPQGIAVIGAVGQRGLPLAKCIQHIAGAASIMGLASGQFQSDWQALGVDKRLDLRRQAAPRAAHTTGLIVFVAGRDAIDINEPDAPFLLA